MTTSPADSPQQGNLTVLLSSGHRCVLDLQPDDPLLKTLMEILSEPERGLYSSSLLRIPLGASGETLLVPRCHVIAVIAAAGLLPEPPAPPPRLPPPPPPSPLRLPPAPPTPPLPPLAEVPREEELGPALFTSRFRSAGRPVILSDALAGWPAAAQYSGEALRERYGALLLPARDGDGERLMRLRDFIDLVEKQRWPGGAAEAPAGLSLQAGADQLEPLLAVPAPLAGLLAEITRRALVASLWYGQRHAQQGPRRGAGELLLVQVRGRLKIDLLGAAPLSCVLLPGEVLYLPAGMSHQTKALDPALTLLYDGGAD